MQKRNGLIIKLTVTDSDLGVHIQLVALFGSGQTWTVGEAPMPICGYVPSADLK